MVKTYWQQNGKAGQSRTGLRAGKREERRERRSGAELSGTAAQ